MSSFPDLVEEKGIVKICKAESSPRRTWRIEVSKYDGNFKDFQEDDTGSTSEKQIIEITINDGNKAVIERLDIYSAYPVTIYIYSYDGSAEAKEYGWYLSSGTIILDLSNSPLVIEKDDLSAIRIKYKQDTAGKIKIGVIGRQLER